MAVVVRAVALVLWAAVLAGLTLSHQDPSQMDPSVPQLSTCLICGGRGTSDALLNIVVFAPLGFLLLGRRWTVARIAVLALLLSASIEVAQHFIPGRYSNLGDVVWNTAGAVLGAWLRSVRAAWMPPAPTRGRLLGDASALLVVSVTLAFGWLMRPDWPVERYWGQWTPELHFMDTYEGAVARARLDSMPIPPGPFPAGHDPRAVLLGEWTMEAMVVKGTPPRALAPMLDLYDGREREVTMLGATGEDLVYRERSHARILRLDQPDLRLPGALAGVRVGDPMELVVRRRGGERCLAVDGREACPGFTPGRAWSLLIYPEELQPRAFRTLDAVWAFALLLPVGLWSGRARGLALRFAGVVAGVALSVAVTRLHGPTAVEVSAGCLGALSGFAARPLLARMSYLVVG